METLIYIALGIVAALIALWLVISVLVLVFVGACNLFAWASESGFVGFAAYIACWVFLFPVMVIICLISGLFTWRIQSNIEKLDREIEIARKNET